MGQGIAEVLTFAVGVAVSPVPIIAVILMLFSARAKVNGPMFLLGWVAALASGELCRLLRRRCRRSVDQQRRLRHHLLGNDGPRRALMLVLALRNWRNRPTPGEQPDMPKWMAGIDDLAPGKALVFGVLLAGVNPKNLILTIGAASGLAQLGLGTTDAVVSLIVFVVVGSLSIAVPVVYYLVGGAALVGRSTI